MRYLTPTTPVNKPHIQAVIDANPKLTSRTKARYKRVLTGYLNAGGKLSDAEQLAACSQGLSKSGRSFLKAAIKLWGESVARRTKAGATPETVNAAQALIFVLEALNEATQVEATKGNKAHSWLTQAKSSN